MKCCERDHNNDGNCDVHLSVGVPRHGRDERFAMWWLHVGCDIARAQGVTSWNDLILFAEAAWNAAVEAENQKRLENGGPG